MPPQVDTPPTPDINTEKSETINIPERITKLREISERLRQQAEEDGKVEMEATLWALQGSLGSMQDSVEGVIDATDLDMYYKRGKVLPPGAYQSQTMCDFFKELVEETLGEDLVSVEIVPGDPRKNLDSNARHKESPQRLRITSKKPKEPEQVEQIVENPKSPIDPKIESKVALLEKQLYEPNMENAQEFLIADKETKQQVLATLNLKENVAKLPEHLQEPVTLMVVRKVVTETLKKDGSTEIKNAKGKVYSFEDMEARMMKYILEGENLDDKEKMVTSARNIRSVTRGIKNAICPHGLEK